MSDNYDKVVCPAGAPLSDVIAITVQTSVSELVEELKPCDEKDARIAELEAYSQYAGEYLCKKHRVEEHVQELRKALLGGGE